MTDTGHYGMGKKRGPYGTNEGDMWLSPGSEIQNRLDAEGKGLIFVNEMMVKDGELQECVYVTANPEMIAEAQEGHERYMAERASKN
jgi:hypothetical protein